MACQDQQRLMILVYLFKSLLNKFKSRVIKIRNIKESRITLAAKSCKLISCGLKLIPHKVYLAWLISFF